MEAVVASTSKLDRNNFPASSCNQMPAVAKEAVACFPHYPQQYNCDPFLQQPRHLSGPTPNSPLPGGSDQRTQRRGAGLPASAVPCHWIATSSKNSAVPPEVNDMLESQQKLSHLFNYLKSWKALALKEPCHHHRCLNSRGREQARAQHCCRSAPQGG